MILSHLVREQLTCEWIIHVCLFLFPRNEFLLVMEEIEFHACPSLIYDCIATVELHCY